MNPKHQRVYLPMTTLLTLTLVAALLILSGAGSVITARAQEGTAEPDAPPVEVTAAPTQPPPAETTAEPPVEVTPAPTEAPVEVTVEPTEPEVTAEPEVTVEPEVTAEPPVATPTTPAVVSPFMDDFQDGDTTGWTVSAGWTVIAEGENLFLSATTPNETLTIDNLNWEHLALTARVRVSDGNMVAVFVRAGTESYTVTIDASGHAALSRGATLLAESVVAEATVEATADPTAEPVWYTIGVQALGSTVTVTVDGVEQFAFADDMPLTTGAVGFSTGAANTGSVAVDDVVVTELDAPAPTESTPTDEATPPDEPSGDPAGDSPAPVTTALLSADFESELTDWAVGSGANIFEVSAGNHALLMAANSTFTPAAAINLASFQIDASFSIVSDDATGETTGLSITFNAVDGQAYVLSVETTQTALYRSDADGLTLLATSETAHDLSTWHGFILRVNGGHIIIAVNGNIEIDFTDDAPLPGGNLAFAANGASSIMLDDVMVTDFNAPVPDAEATETVGATPLPEGITPENEYKLAGSINRVITAFNDEGADAAFAIANSYGMNVDETGRIRVVIVAAEGFGGVGVVSAIEAVGGEIHRISDRDVEASVPLGGFVALVNTPEVGSIHLPAEATSTGNADSPNNAPTGDVHTEAFNVLGINAWHVANIRGTGANVAVIDTGFSNNLVANNSPDNACAGTTLSFGTVAGGDTNHGLRVVEVICDIAPNSIVRMYKATDTTTMAQAIAAARAPGGTQADVIVIAMDLGAWAGPGDGTLGYNTANDPYTEISAARNAGIVVVASAGNSNGRYQSFTYSGGGTTTMTLTANNGDVVNVSWNDWDNNQNGGAPREDITVRVREGGTTIDSHTAASSRVGNPGVQLTIGGCTPAGGFCTLTVEVTALSAGGSPVVVQIQATGDGALGAPSGAGFSALANPFGSLARPADSPHVITVGAVCISTLLNYPVYSGSSHGPLYSAGGGAPAVPPVLGYAGNVVKPTLMSATYVSTDIDGSANTESCEFGFEGTSASAAHIGGIAALLKSSNLSTVNSSMASFSGTSSIAVDSIRLYLQQHTFEMPFGDTADGFDTTFGAGFAVLGSPTYNIAQIASPSTPDNIRGTECLGLNGTFLESEDLVYVSLANINDASADGTLAHPFPSLAYAVTQVPQDGCVIAGPGEFTTPLFLNNAPNSANIMAYDYVSSVDMADSIFNVYNIYNEAAFYITDDEVTVSGFVFLPTSRYSLFGADPLTDQYIFRFDGATNSGARGNVMSSFSVSSRSMFRVENSSTGVFIDDNTITNNISGTGAVPVLRIHDSGTSGNRIEFTNNTVTGNTNRSGAVLNFDTFESIMTIDDSYADVVNNVIQDNIGETIIRVETATDASTLVTRVMGNVFLNNTTISDGPQPQTGPMINLFYTPQFFFINNTVVGNDVYTSTSGSGGSFNTEFGAIIGRGDAADNEGTPGNGTINAGPIGMYNNLFYNNIANPEQGLFDNMDSLGSACNDPSGGAGLGAQYNWISDSDLSFDAVNAATGEADGGECHTAIINIGNNNIRSGAINHTTQFFGPSIGLDLTNPLYYAPVQYSLGNFSDNVEAGGDSFIEQAADIPFDVFNLRDAGGNARMADGNGDSTIIVDIGAYELVPLDFTILVTDASPFPFYNVPAFDEDVFNQGVNWYIIDLAPLVEGGFGQLTFTVDDALAGNNEFPANFGTQCGSIFFGTRGAVIGGGNNDRIYFCPPVDFFTDGGVGYINDATVPDYVDINFTVTDSTNASIIGEVRIYINPTADTALSTVIGDQTPANDIFDIIIDESEVNATFRVRPYVTFGNFRFSEANNSEGTIQDQIDYPFIYGANLSFISGVDVLVTTTGVVNTATGVATVNPSGALPPGGSTGLYSYAVQNTNATTGAVQGSVTNFVRIRVVNQTPSEGLHDDTSTVFNYTGVWSPLYSENNINNSLHSSNAVNATSEFAFRGTGFTLYMQGDARGGDWRLTINGENVTWTAPVGGSTISTFNGTIGADAVTCSTRASTLGTNISNMRPGGDDQITAASRDAYTVSCNGLSTARHTVVMTNLVNARTLVVDAFSIITDNTTPPTLTPGFHDVDEDALNAYFGGLAGWSTLINTAASNKLAMSGVGAATDVQFSFNNATGFAIGTTLELNGAVYDICVQEQSQPATETCQRLDNSRGATTRVLYNVFRPFFGFNPTNTYDVTISIVSNPGQLVVDSIVIFNDVATNTLGLGTTEDSSVDMFVLNNGLADSWLYDGNSRLVPSGNLTSINRTVSYAGPFVSFEIPGSANALLFNTTFDTRGSETLMVCVDRARGVGSGLHGNCIEIDTNQSALLTAGQFQYSLVNTDGTTTAMPGTVIQPFTTSRQPSTIVITESLFQGGTWGAGVTHIVEIFSTTHGAFTFDSVTALDTSAALPAGTFQEFVPNLRTFDAGGTLDAGNFTTIIDRRASGGGYIQTQTTDEGMYFAFNGSGVTINFVQDRYADAIRICWLAGTGHTVATVEAGTCDTIDNQNARLTYGAAYSILGLTPGDYTVTVRMLVDNSLPAAHVATALPITLKFDSIVVHGGDISTLNQLTDTDGRIEGHFVNSAANIQFLYNGSWTTTEGARARLQSAENYDLTRQQGSGVAFRTTGVNAILFYRSLRNNYANIKVCYAPEASPTNQTCVIISNAGSGHQRPVAVNFGMVQDYIVNISTISTGDFIFDAIELYDTSTPLGAGTYQETTPWLNFTGTWASAFRNQHNGGSVIYSLTAGAETSFAFTGTGFEIGTVTDRYGGEAEICYDDDATFDEGVETGADQQCFIYQNESTRTSYTVSRTVGGLANGTYYVRIRDVEDGLTAVTSNPATARIARYIPARVYIDFLRIFDDAVPPTAVVGTFNENAVDGGGDPYLQLLPHERWENITGNFARNYSEQSFNAIVDDRSRTRSNANYAGPMGTFRVDTNLGDATIILYTYRNNTRNSNQLLVCAGNVDGEIDWDGINYSLINSTNCTLETVFTTTTQIVINRNDLAVLASGNGVQTITFRALTPSAFEIDSYQITYGVTLEPGFYEDFVGSGDSGDGIAQPFELTGTFTTTLNTRYSGGSALVSTPGGDSVTFDITNATGFTFLTQFENTGGNLLVEITGLPNEVVSTFNSALIQGTAGFTFAGLPLGDYTVTITNQTSSRLVLDAVEVYGALSSLGSLYDDNVTDTNGDLLLTYGPGTSNWVVNVGTRARGYLNETYHTTNDYGAAVSFIANGGTETVNGIVVYYGTRNTSSVVRVCFTRLDTNARDCTSTFAPSDRVGRAQINIPVAVSGHTQYAISLVNEHHNGTFDLDAVQILEGSNLSEGIFDVNYLQGVGAFGAGWTFANNEASGSFNSTLDFTFTGIGVTIVLKESTGTSAAYTVCVDPLAGGGQICDTINNGAATQPLLLARAGIGDFALSFFGLHSDAAGNDGDYTVTITNNDPSLPLVVKRVEILGADTSLQFNGFERVENTDPRIQYVPFGSLNEVISRRAGPSGLSQHIGNMRGAVAYFEFDERGFQYGREMSRSYGTGEVCFAPLGTPSTNATCTPFDNTTAVAYQQTLSVDSGVGVCGISDICYGFVRNLNGRNMPVDFIRNFDGAQPMTAGFYQETYPGLQFFDGTFAFVGGAYTGGSFQPTVDTRASGGTVTSTSAIDDGMVFRMTGTGFSVYFTNDRYADALRICWLVDATPIDASTVNDVLTTGTCQTFDNTSTRTENLAARTIVGLANNTYSVVVQMLDDNYQPTAHDSRYTPLTMKIDAVEVYDTDWTALNPLDAGTMYEANFVNRALLNDFAYFRDGWYTDIGARARRHSNEDIDFIRSAIGAGIVFRTTNADAVVIYRPVRRGYSDMLVCAAPEANPSNRNCTIISNEGTGEQQPITFHYNTGAGTAAHVVSIITLGSGQFGFDAVMPVDADVLTPGTYDDTAPGIYYDTSFTNLIVNGDMEINDNWSNFGAPSTNVQLSTARYINRYGWHVAASDGNGTQSEPFTMESGVTYTIVARVRLIGTGNTGVVRMSDTSANFTVDSTNTVNVWQTLRITYTPTSTQTVRLAFFANGGNVDFYLDDVWMTTGGRWQQVFSRNHGDGHMTQSLTHGAEVRFAFTGTGAAVNMPLFINGGGVQVCYDDDANFDEGAETGADQHCIIYDNESKRTTYNAYRVVAAGLANGTYYVRIRDAEDGTSSTGKNPFVDARNSRYAVGQVSVDTVYVFGDAAPTVVPGGFYNQDAVDSGGEPFLQLLVPEHWTTISGSAARTAIGGNYLTLADANGRQNIRNAGGMALLNIDVPASASNVTVILYTTAGSRRNSSQLLICTDYVDGEVGYDDVNKVFVINNSTNCLITNTLWVNNQVVVTGVELPALSQAGTSHNLIIASLTAGAFNIEGYQIIAGTRLSEGINDDFLPDTLLNFETDLNRDTRLCNMNLEWCLRKDTRSVGGYSAQTNVLNQTLTFDFEGTGFAVLTTVGTRNANMMICYRQESSVTPFPTDFTDYTNNYVGVQDEVNNGGVWCENPTTNTGTTDWVTYNGSLINPRRGNSYGFSYYGLPNDNYTVHVQHVDTRSYTLVIDAIVVYGDVTDNAPLTAGLHDDTTSSLSYEPFAFWTLSTNFRQAPPRGAYNATEHTASNAGAVTQVYLTGNAFTLYQTANTRNSHDVQICVLVVTEVAIHCGDEGEANLINQVGNFSQNGRRTYFTPIVFYGLGDGNHVIIFENREHGRFFSVDAIRVWP